MEVEAEEAAGLGLQGSMEVVPLDLRKSSEEGLEKDDRLAQTGIKVVMVGVEQVPVAFGVTGLAQ
jgi:hypothetical protein